MMVVTCVLAYAPVVIGQSDTVDLQGDFTTYKNRSLAVAGTDKDLRRNFNWLILNHFFN
jgi:hypothetical protein